MYLSKPEEGFCIPVLYINRKELDISNLLDIDKVSENYEMNYLGKEFYNDLPDNKEESLIKDEVLNAPRGEENDRLIFDTDEGDEKNESLESLIERKINGADSEGFGVLIFDGEPMEEANK